MGFSFQGTQIEAREGQTSLSVPAKLAIRHHEPDCTTDADGMLLFIAGSTKLAGQTFAIARVYQNRC